MPDVGTRAPTDLQVHYDPATQRAELRFDGDPSASIWSRIRTRALEDPESRLVASGTLVTGWPTVLEVLRDYGSREQQRLHAFRFRFQGEAANLAKRFGQEVREANEARRSVPLKLTWDEARALLATKGFTAEKRLLRAFQVRDLLHLASLAHGANFSVPGAGKTTVTLALDLLVAADDWRLLVIGPKSAFPAWLGVIDECIDRGAAGAQAEPFVVLDGDADENAAHLEAGRRFVMSYDLMIRQPAVITSYLTRHPVHLVLDEAHRMKAGAGSQRGAFLLKVSPFAARRDILTGTPMPQGPDDLASQLGFLWPGQGLSSQVIRGVHPREVLGQLYVRTTKQELGLPRPHRHFIDVPMQPGQQALYGLVRSEHLRRLTASVRQSSGSVDFASARKSVMRLLQLSANPVVALKAIADETVGLSSGVVDAVVAEAPSGKVRAVTELTRKLAAEGRKVVVWTIFTETIRELEGHLAPLNPVTLYGAVPSGSDLDPSTREGRLLRFHSDPACMVLIANPAASGEGISLHTVCHDAIYLDRSYVSTHYLQSTDRIHRLGLPAGVDTNIFIFRTAAPAGLGSIDLSVSRRLVRKVRALQELLNDTDLHEIALDEESADDPVDYSVDLQDLVDLVDELEGKGKPFDEAEEE